MTGGKFYVQTERQTAGYPTLGEAWFNWLFPPPPVYPEHLRPGLLAIQPFDVNLTPTVKILTPVSNTPNNFRRVYYMVISVKNMGVSPNFANTIFVGFKQSQSSIQLNNYNSYYEWAAVPGQTLDLSGLSLSCDQFTSVVTISGVSY